MIFKSDELLYGIACFCYFQEKTSQQTEILYECKFAYSFLVHLFKKNNRKMIVIVKNKTQIWIKKNNNKYVIVCLGSK